MKDIYGHEIPSIEESTMNYLDNAIKQLNGAHDDLSKENAAAAAEDYGRCTSNHHACVLRDAAFKAQIERLIMCGEQLVNPHFPYPQKTSWSYEVGRARELIK